ncbi:MAG: hypothetical protein JSU67_14710 [Gammaproteobacteria bacterium]|nr:MAG: hypothetical protein EP300_04885 [Gammaproteobacteria bacterium]UCH39397.1 MAG: hypothetical protein JSU67_14710 [Gammaproteobacteria bacterium]
MKSSRLKSLLSLAILLSAFVAEAGRASWEISSSIDLGMRIFMENPRWPNQDDATTQLSIAGTTELRWRGDDSRASIIPYLRYDETDDERSLADLKEAYWAKEAESYELLIGINTVFWGVTESVHLVDIINQTDGVADIDGEDKLGQPMINLEMQRDWGLIGAYLLPYFRERTFAGKEGRLRTPLPVDTDNPQYESSEEENHIDLALRYSHFVGSVDIGLSAFSGTSREPRLLPNADGSALIPVYDQIEQLGLDLQYTDDAWLWKLEAIVRETKNDSFNAAVGGFEYTFYQVADSTTDVGVLLELQYDGRAGDQPITLADNDLFAGIRLAFNDTQDTAVLAGVGYDVETSETYVNIEADRRLGDAYVLELRARIFTNADAGDTSFAIGKDDYLQVQLSRYF